MPLPRQTVSYLRDKFAEIGLDPDHRHGQNFLIDLNLVDLLVKSAQLDKRDVVLEVGTGTGSLTARMAERAGWVITVEIDQHLHQFAGEVLDGVENVTLLHCDALHNKNRFAEPVLAAVRDRMAAIPNARFKLAANLPYNIATPVIANLLCAEIVPHSMTVTIQKELADRILAPPCTKDYSALSVWVQSLCRGEIVRVLSPGVFWPRPKVTSAIIHLEPDPELRAQIPHLEYFRTFVRSLFLHRRKFLRGVLVASFKSYSKTEIDLLLADMGFTANARAEELTPAGIFALSERMRERLMAEQALPND